MIVKDKVSVDDLLFEAVFQACSVHDSKGKLVVDTMCLKPFEDACAYLASIGYLSTVNGRVYYLVIAKPRKKEVMINA